MDGLGLRTRGRPEQEQGLDADGAPPLGGEEVVVFGGQRVGRAEEDLLLLLGDHRHGRAHHGALATAHIALDEPLHGNAAAKVTTDGVEHGLLAIVELPAAEPQRAAGQAVLHAVGGAALATLGGTEQREAELDLEQLIEREAQAALALDVAGEVHVAQGEGRG